MEGKLKLNLIPDETNINIAYTKHNLQRLIDYILVEQPLLR